MLAFLVNILQGESLKSSMACINTVAQLFSVKRIRLNQ